MNRYSNLCLFLIGLFFLMSCNQGPSHAAGDGALPEADTTAMQLLQGVWVDEETEAVACRVKGDSVFYPDSTSHPVRFAIYADTLKIYAATELCYPILRQGENVFQYETLTGEYVRLRRSEVAEDTLAFDYHEYAPILLNEEVRRDTVMFTPSGERYHLYVDVNPTRYRVHHTTYTDAGLPIDVVYYDNIIHAAVYSGRDCLFSHDFVKTDFQKLIPPSFIEGAILSNMEFASLDDNHCCFHATLCQPDGASCYVVKIQVGYDGTHDLELLEY